jgi:hypothetical protein
VWWTWMKMTMKKSELTTQLLHEENSRYLFFLFALATMFLLGFLCTPKDQLPRSISSTTRDDGLIQTRHWFPGRTCRGS